MDVATSMGPYGDHLIASYSSQVNVNPDPKGSQTTPVTSYDTQGDTENLFLLESSRVLQ
jgi:hypothetical protein